ncbi:putative essential protein Yae1 [Trifolium medium]|uniref:Putative essential protein Yae1 n=1 Tax=Trifolium medium TaxID=97028 RepID=A0A392M7T7_9FABA|nr:putative essential protein Yae1 [Trifolium medium]
MAAMADIWTIAIGNLRRDIHHCGALGRNGMFISCIFSFLPSAIDNTVVKFDDCDHGYGNLDDSVWDDSDEVFNDASELDREWQLRHDQFHTMGYRDGLFAGKEAAAQEGFNIGFKQSVLHGSRWGLVRGVTSVGVVSPTRVRHRDTPYPRSVRAS